MNAVLRLRKSFDQAPNSGRSSPPNLPEKAKPVSAEHLCNLAGELEKLKRYWAEQKIISGALIDIHYISVIAKSRRVKGYFNKGKTPDQSVVGARFDNGNAKDPKHIITHYVTLDALQDTIDNVASSIKLLEAKFGGKIANADIAGIHQAGICFDDYNLSKTSFLNMVVDAHYIESFGIPSFDVNAVNQQIVRIYKTDNTTDILRSIGIVLPPGKVIGETILSLHPDELELLKDKAPYLIAMSVEDITKLDIEDVMAADEAGGKKLPDSPDIDDPTDEPVIGVIDTLFDKSVYFSKWVEFRDMTDPEIPQDDDNDYRHGTAVTSIVVDGPRINPALDDGCGRFRVRHFGVAKGKAYSSLTVMKMIKEIVASNPDIKVWNLSLGSPLEINANFISPEAAVLDEIQYEYDVVFVVAGTNKANNSKEELLIGSPADSINSIVVNAVDKKGEPASYARKGRVLFFYNKPDVAAFGGDGTIHTDGVCVYEGASRATFCRGTSFASPWIARKMAYLIEILGLSREVAKALLVDAAAAWDDTGNNPRLAPLIGHGVVPVKVEEIINSKNDEIKFIMTGESKSYNTYAYDIPVPIAKDKHPFVAKVTLCYFPKCSPDQGVDYTNTELDISIGRIDGKGIKSIDKNVQSVEGCFTYEGDARRLFRKWDNTKHIREKYGERLSSRKAYERGMWGVSVKAKERLEARNGYGIKFGLVVTLKEINGVNRIHEFKQKAQIAGWLVSEINVDAQLDIYHRLQEKLEI
jgi:hypothetical protein